MYEFQFSKSAQKAFLKLSKKEQERVFTKLQFLKTHEDIFSVLRPLQNFEPATHRLRVGSLRLILELLDPPKETAKSFKVLELGHRRDIYN